VTANNKWFINRGDGSSPSEAHGGGGEGLGLDGEEPALNLSIRSDVSPIMEIEMLTRIHLSLFISGYSY
jgi:hypothetical protein